MTCSNDENGKTRCPWLWLIRRPAMQLMLADREQFASLPAGPFRRAWIELLLFSLAWGLLNIGLWDLATRGISSASGLPLVPAGLVLLAGGMWLYRRSVVALGKLAAPKETAGAALVGALVAVFWLLVLLDLPGPLPSTGMVLPAGLQWLRPLPWYRVLLLSPIWGAWAMLITCQFCRPDRQSSPAIAALATGCGPASAAMAMVVPLAGSLYYFNHLSWWQSTIPASAIVAATVGGWLFCNRFGGLRREALLAVNVLTQIVFTVAYLVNRSFP